MIARSCIWPGCHRLAHGSRCPEHTTAMNRLRNAQRDPVAAAVYASPAWRQLAREVVADATACHWCGRVGVRLSADHVLGVRSRPDLALDPGNVVAACYSCQNRRRGQ